MTNIYEVVDAHPFLTFCVVYMMLKFLEWPFRLVNRTIRHLNIRKAGWPPEYLDADGDIHRKEEEEEKNKEQGKL